MGDCNVAASSRRRESRLERPLVLQAKAAREPLRTFQI